MPEVTKKTVDSLKSQVAQCNSKVNELQLRISQLVDEKSLLENQLNRLQETVAQDIKFLYEKLN